jgi:hypothetical protein
VFESLKKNLIPSPSKKTEILDVMMLRADLLMEMRQADSIPFIGFASIFSDRQFACRLEINFKLGTHNERKVFQSEATHNRSWFDMESSKKKEIVESCVDALVSQVAEFANSFLVK